MRYSLKTWFIAVAAISLVLGLLGIMFETDRRARRARINAACQYQIRRVWEALSQYDSVHGALPPATITDEAGLAFHSWRAVLLEHLQEMAFEKQLFDRYRWNEVWNSTSNTAVARLNIGVETYNCPLHYVRTDQYAATYLAVTGTGTAFDPSSPHRLADLPSDLILLIERCGECTPWSKPIDASLDDIREAYARHGSVLASRHLPPGGHVLFADGSIWYLRAEVPLAALEKFLTIESAARSDREDVLGPHGVWNLK
jgi:hypothetical protein